MQNTWFWIQALGILTAWLVNRFLPYAKCFFTWEQERREAATWLSKWRVICMLKCWSQVASRMPRGNPIWLRPEFARRCLPASVCEWVAAASSLRWVVFASNISTSTQKAHTRERQTVLRKHVHGSHAEWFYSLFPFHARMQGVSSANCHHSCWDTVWTHWEKRNKPLTARSFKSTGSGKYLKGKVCIPSGAVKKCWLRWLHGQKSCGLGEGTPAAATKGQAPPTVL